MASLFDLLARQRGRAFNPMLGGGGGKKPSIVDPATEQMQPVQMQSRQQMAPPPPLMPPPPPQASVAPSKVKITMLDRAEMGVQTAMEAASGGAMSPVVRDLLGEDAVKAARTQGLMALGSSLLQDSGWKDARNSVTLGQALGRGLQASQQVFGQQVNGAVNDAVQAQNANAMQAQREAIQEDFRSRTDQRNAAIADADRLAKLQPEYMRLLEGVENMPLMDQAKRYSSALRYAEYIGDDKTAQRITTLFQSGMFKQPDPVKMTTEEYDGGIWAFDPVAGEGVRRLGDAPPRGSGGGGGLRVSVGGDGAIPKGMVGVYNNVQKGVMEVTRLAEGMRASIGRLETEAKNPLNQIAALYDFIRTRDNSTVRDGERTLVASANSLLGRFNLSVEKLRSGAIMTKAQMDGVQRIMRSEIDAKRVAIGKGTDDSRRMLRDSGVDISSSDSVLATPVPDRTKPQSRGATAVPLGGRVMPLTKAQADARKKMFGGR